jgi:hypothetical protein
MVHARRRRRVALGFGANHDARSCRCVLLAIVSWNPVQHCIATSFGWSMLTG